MMNKILSLAVLIVLCLAGAFPSTADMYSSGGKRDPFVPLIGGERSSVRQGLEEIYSIEDVYLQGILVSPDGNKSAIVNGEIVREGEKRGIFFIEGITDNCVKVNIGGEKFEIQLYDK